MSTTSKTGSPPDRVDRLVDELENFQEMVRFLHPSPGEIPRLDGIDVAGVSRPLNLTGGDHLIYLDFKARYDLERRIRQARAEGRDQVAARLIANRDRAGFLVADASGHRATDALVAAMLHQAFLVGARYELDIFGEITTSLFEHINMRFYKTSSVHRYLTMLYGEIAASGTFRFITAGHPPPVIFSPETGACRQPSRESLAGFPPVGVLPTGNDLDERGPADPVGYKKQYRVNQIGPVRRGEIILLATDGLFEHADGAFYPREVERCLAARPDAPAEQIGRALERKMLDLAPPADDVTFVVIKKTA